LVWNVATTRCIHQFEDFGSEGATSMDISKDGKWLATGSGSGIVNIYHIKDVSKDGKSTPTPYLEKKNLVTQITTLKFNHDSQLLLVASPENPGALRFLHIPSFNVYSNWPTSSTPLDRVNSANFSSGSGYLVTGDLGGHLRFYRIQQYNKE